MALCIFVLNSAFKFDFVMQLFKYLFVSLLVFSIFSCHTPEKVKKNALFDYVLPQTSYVVKVNKTNAITQPNPLIADLYLNSIDKNFLSQSGYQYPFIINIFQNNSKLKGFVAVGKTSQIDSVFDKTGNTYDNFPIYKQVFNKQDYFATQIDGSTFISNQKLFIENTIRDRKNFGQLTQIPTFNKGVQSLDNNASMNLLIMSDNFKPDALFHSSLKIKYADIADWQFLDLVEVPKQIASGIGLKTDTIGTLNRIFSGVHPQSKKIMNLVPYAVDEAVVLSFDDFDKFHKQLTQQASYTPKHIGKGSVLESLTAVNYFKEGSNQAVLLQMDKQEKLTGNESEKIKDFNNYGIYKYGRPNLINNFFSGILPAIATNFYTVIEGKVLMTETEAYLEKVLNDIQNHATLSNSQTYQNLRAEIPDDYHLILFRNKLKIAGQSYMKVQTYKVDKQFLFTNLVLKNFTGAAEQGIIEQVLSYNLNDLPNTPPQLVYNHKTKQYDIIYQDEQDRLTLVNLKGKKLWQTELKGKISGKIRQVDLYRNHKLQYTFVTPHHWYVIDRLGRKVDDFPDYFLQKITKGISVFDYDKNRKYRFGITQSSKFRLFDSKAKKVKGFKVKTEEDIIRPPQHFRIGSKDFIVMQDADGKLYLLNRRGDVRIKVSKEFKTTRNAWGVFNNKFVNIDDDDRLISIDLSGKIKTGKTGLGTNILSDIKYHTLTAVADNKLLINKKVLDLDLGTYERPHIFKVQGKIYILIANQANHKIYAFDSKGNPIKNFPIIGQEVLDFKGDKNGRYLLVYDSTKNIMVYKF